MNQEIQTVKDNAVDQEILVTKRDGSKESIDLEKIHRVVHWASQDLENISVSQVEINAQLAFFDGIKTEDIHETIIKSVQNVLESWTNQRLVLTSTYGIRSYEVMTFFS